MNKIEIINIVDNIKNKIECVFYKGEEWNLFDSGLTRKVFVNSECTKVIKLLIDEHGINHNQIEFDIYSNSNSTSEFALTEISSDKSIIEQEFVLPIKFSNKELSLKEIQFANSCRGEVGWNINNKLVCFDLDEYRKY
jgi:hypothetical protein